MEPMLRPAPRTVAVLCALAAAAALGVAHAAEVWGQLVPCALCLLERWPYRLVVVLALLAAIVASGSPRSPDTSVRSPRTRLASTLLVLAIVVLLVEAAIAAVHVGVEFRWWPSPLPECAAPHISGASIADRLASMPARPSKPCDDATFLIPGLPISMAAMNLLYALALAAGVAISLSFNRSRR